MFIKRQQAALVALLTLILDRASAFLGDIPQGAKLPSATRPIAATCTGILGPRSSTRSFASTAAAHSNKFLFHSTGRRSSEGPTPSTITPRPSSARTCRPDNRNSRTATKLHGNTLFNENGSGDENEDYETSPSQQASNVFYARLAVLSAPALMAAMGFSLYPATSTSFHSFVDTASGHTWAAVDGGKYLTDLITPALNGPVASFVSLLFGTLTSMTVGTLYQRQFNMYQLTTDLLEDVRLAEIHFQYFPIEYREHAMGLVGDYKSVLAIYFDEENDPSREEIMKSREIGSVVLEKLLILLHDISTSDGQASEKVSDRILDEAYQTINRLIRNRSKLISTYDSSFPIWHYGNLAVLAAAICTIFLVLTDRTALQFLGGFQLRLCWAMLVGTISMLAAVIYDLNTPLSGVFQVTRSNKSATLQIWLDDSTNQGI